MPIEEIYDLLDEKDRINALPEAPQEVEEYLGEVICGIENRIDRVIENIKFKNLPKN